MRFDSSLPRFLAIGLVSTLAYALLFLALRGWLGPGGANGVVLVVASAAATVTRYLALRTWVFAGAGRAVRVLGAIAR